MTALTQATERTTEPHPPAGLVIRPFEPVDADYEKFVELGRAIWPDNATTVEVWQHQDKSRDPRYFHDRWLAEIDGRPVGDGFIMQPAWAFVSGRYQIYVEVKPEFRGRGIGTALLNMLMELVLLRRPTALGSFTREDQTEGVRWMGKHGFKLVLREQRSALDVTAFDFASFRPVVEAVTAKGIQLRTLAELRETDPNWLAKLHQLDNLIMEDVPMDVPYTPPALDQYAKQLLSGPAFTPQAFFIALDGDQYVGMSSLRKDMAKPERLYTDLTGVRREYRRQGIAIALKLRAIEFARQGGVTEIETDNEENNPMYQINLRLGYRPAPAWVHFASS